MTSLYSEVITSPFPVSKILSPFLTQSFHRCLGRIFRHTLFGFQFVTKILKKYPDQMKIQRLRVNISTPYKKIIFDNAQLD